MSFAQENNHRLSSQWIHYGRLMFHATIYLVCFVLLISEKSNLFAMVPSLKHAGIEMVDHGRSSAGIHSGEIFVNTEITQPSLYEIGYVTPEINSNEKDSGLFHRKPSKLESADPPPSQEPIPEKFQNPKKKTASSKLKKITLKLHSLLKKFTHKLGDFIKWLFLRRTKKPAAPTETAHEGYSNSELENAPLLYNEMNHPSEFDHLSDVTLQTLQPVPHLDNRQALSGLKDIKLVSERPQDAVLVPIENLPGYLKTQRFIEMDGNCLFRAFAFYTTRNQENHANVRQEMIRYIKGHPDKFLEFITQEDLPIREESSSAKRLEAYCEWMSQDKVYGDQISITALKELYDSNIAIVSHSGESISTVTYSSITDKNAAYMGLYLKDEHYELLYKDKHPEFEQITSNI